MEPHVTKLSFSVDAERLHTELDNLLEDVGFVNPSQLTLTSVLGNNHWHESTGKIKHVGDCLG